MTVVMFKRWWYMEEGGMRLKAMKTPMVRRSLLVGQTLVKGSIKR